MSGSDGWSNIQDMINGLGAGPGAGAGQTPANALGGNNLAGGSAPMVYWGPGNVVHRNTGGRDSSSQEEGDKALGITRNRPGDNIITVQQAVADWYKWSDTEKQAFGLRAYRLGLVSDPNKFSDVFGVWQDAVQQASNYYTIGNRKVTPWQTLDIIGGVTGGAGPSTTTQTNTSVNIPTVDEAHALTRQLFQALMGRDPTGDELNRYASMVTAYAQKHPSVSKATGTTDSKGNTTSSSTSTGGIAGMQDALGQQIKTDPEYGAYQAATTYFNALMQAVGGTGG